MASWVQDTSSCRLHPRQEWDTSDMQAGETPESKATVENDPEWRCDRNTYFKDLSTHPCRPMFRMAPLRLRPCVNMPVPPPVRRYDYGLKRSNDTGLLVPRDRRIYTKHRRFQMASQVHKCTFTCWKYNNNPFDRFTCRFESHLWSSASHMHDDATILRDRDRKGRVRVRVLPPRNNHHVNNHMVCPSVAMALGCSNMDIQAIVDGQHGTAEYCCSYV